MAEIGSLGDKIIFAVSPEKVLTFNKLQKTTKGRWASHDIIGKTPKAEFLGPGQGSLSFSIYVTVMHNVNPKQVIQELNEAAEQGTPLTFILGSSKVGKNKWVIDSVSEAWDAMIDEGRLLSANLNISLTEYA